MARVRQARRCRAHRKDGQPCRCFAINGGYVCRIHGGAARQVKRKARERLLEAEAWRTLAAWQRNPAAQEWRDRAAVQEDYPALLAFVERLT